MAVFPAFALQSSVYWPFAVLFLCVGLVIFLITVVRLHAFMSLILAAIAAGLLAGPQLKIAPGANRYVQAVEMTATELGTTAGKIAIVIAMASVIALCLQQSGAADKVVRRFLAVIGEKNAGFALFLSSFILSIPIFFDTFFMLVLPIAQALALRLKKNYLLFLMSITASSAATHVLVAPHPGPLAMAEALNLKLGVTIMAGLLVGIVPAFVAWLAANWINKLMPIPFRPAAGTSVADLESSLTTPEDQLPSFIASILPIIIPIALISASSIVAAIPTVKVYNGQYHLIKAPLFISSVDYVRPFIDFIGNRNVALIIGAVLAMAVLVKQKGYSIAKICQLIGPPLETGGTIILITSAGGAFGLMLKNAGVGEAVKAAAAGREVNFILLAWLVSSVIRIAQGSATVAMLTTAAMMVSIIQGEGAVALPYNPIYIFVAIGFGSIICSWMNDSGFWVIAKLSGLTEKETLKSWTVTTTILSFSGVLFTLLLSKILPLA